jgi:hypothetical protein
MRRSLILRTNPSVRETQRVLARIERALQERGAVVRRPTAGELDFRLPPPWKLARGWLALISGGSATVSAWGGGPWRVSYFLRFGALRALTALLTLVLAVIGWGWPRFALISSLLALWIVGAGTLHILAAHDFRRFLRGTIPDMIERRSHPRITPKPSQTITQQPE